MVNVHTSYVSAVIVCVALLMRSTTIHELLSVLIIVLKWLSMQYTYEHFVWLLNPCPHAVSIKSGCVKL